MRKPISVSFMVSPMVKDLTKLLPSWGTLEEAPKCPNIMKTRFPGWGLEPVSYPLHKGVGNIFKSIHASHLILS